MHLSYSMYSMRKNYFDSSSRSAGKPQKMHRLCETRKRKEFSAVGWFGSINYLTKLPPAPPLISSSSCLPTSILHFCQRFSPEAPSACFVYVSIPSTTPTPSSLFLSLCFLLLCADTLVDPTSRPQSEISS